MSLSFLTLTLQLYQVLPNKQIYFENIITKNFLLRNKLESNVRSFTILSCPHFNYVSAANVFKSEYFTRLEISNPWTNFSLFLSFIKYDTRKFLIIRISEIFLFNICYFNVIT